MVGFRWWPICLVGLGACVGGGESASGPSAGSTAWSAPAGGAAAADIHVQPCTLSCADAGWSDAARPSASEVMDSAVNPAMLADGGNARLPAPQDLTDAGGTKATAQGDSGIPDAAIVDPRPPGVALCYTEFSSSHAATVDFWAAMRAADLSARANAIAALQDAALRHPMEQEFALLLGLAHLWRVAEPAAGQELDLVGLLEAISASETELERAYALCPTDHRIPAWLAPIRTKAGAIAGDMSLVQQGLDILEVGLEHYPGFVLFSKLLVHADLPPTDPQFLDAVDGVRQNLEYCGTLISGLSDDPACPNHPRAAHNVEGAAVVMGDAFVKAQDLEAARDIYEQAKLSPDYGTWNYQQLLEERIATIETRAAAYATPLPLDDPQAAWQSTIQCSICHRD